MKITNKNILNIKTSLFISVGLVAISAIFSLGLIETEATSCQNLDYDYNPPRSCPAGYINTDCSGSCATKISTSSTSNPPANTNINSGSNTSVSCQNLDYDYNPPRSCPAGYINTDCSGSCATKVGSSSSGGSVSAGPCPFSADNGDTVVYFGNSLRSDLGFDRSNQVVSQSIPAGNYTVKLASYDGYDTRISTVAQPNERFYLKLTNNNGNVLATTNSTSDLQDGVQIASWSGIVNTGFNVPEGITRVIAWHSVYPDKSSPNSVRPVCALFDKVTENVNPQPSCSMSVQPSSIKENQSASLSWSSNNVTSVVIDNGVGNVSVNGSKNVSPNSNTTYTGTFSGPYGTVVCHTSITIVPTDPKAPTCSMNISDSSIEAGESVSLSWGSTNVTSVSIDHGVGSVSTTGSSNLYPTTNTTYTGTFTGPEGTVTCSSFVEVIENPEAPTCSLGVNPSVLSPGQSATLYWSSKNISTTTIDNNIGLVNNSGAISVNPGNNTTYTGTFKGKNKTITCSATVTLGGGGVNPPTVSLSSNTFGSEPSYIYLSQIPYTGIPDFVIYLFRIIFFGGLLYAYYRLSGRSWKLKKN